MKLIATSFSRVLSHMSLIGEGRQLKRGKYGQNVPNWDSRLSAQYPSLSKLLKKGYLGYLPGCTPCLKVLSKTHSHSLDPREPRLVKLLPRRIFNSKVGKMGESITLAWQQGKIRQNKFTKRAFFLIIYLIPFIFGGKSRTLEFERLQRVNCYWLWALWLSTYFLSDQHKGINMVFHSRFVFTICKHQRFLLSPTPKEPGNQVNQLQTHSFKRIVMGNVQ